jgi:hypothetical protein
VFEVIYIGETQSGLLEVGLLFFLKSKNCIVDLTGSIKYTVWSVVHLLVNLNKVRVEGH